MITREIWYKHYGEARNAIRKVMNRPCKEVNWNGNEHDWEPTNYQFLETVTNYHAMVISKMCGEDYLDIRDALYNALTGGDFWVNEYILDRCYGGPEEGGWWYNTGIIIGTHRFSDPKAADRAAERLYKQKGGKEKYKLGSILCSGVYGVRLETNKGRNFPQHRPYYE